MPSPEDIKQRIEASIPGAYAEVEDYTGGGDHFRAIVTAAAFAGRSRIEQHRLVYDIFGAEIGGPIHALSLKTQLPDTAATADAPVESLSASQPTTTT
jgi:stress-induced morphogen